MELEVIEGISTNVIAQSNPSFKVWVIYYGTKMDHKITSIDGGCVLSFLTLSMPIALDGHEVYTNTS